MDTYKKISESEIEVKKTTPEEIIPEKEEVKTYDYDFLVAQQIQVDQDLSNVIARHAVELEVAQANVDEVNLLLKSCTDLGIGNDVIIEK